ncbi:hypothetical protein JTB14_015456 [Gonioctena quinquepunctata]|nr:hypothetical protein JTB14_015456 [Gonioctena quinquepunctata]
MSQNNKRFRANLSPEIINQYFDNLEINLKDFPASNIVNYDETNLSDDPGRLKVVCKRGVKRVDRIIDSSKTSTSIMIAVSGSEQLLKPHVVYKATHLYPTWVENGPEGIIYNRSKSGWFDGEIFENWFQEVALPYFKKCHEKVLIGDNLSSHISLHVIQECRNNDIIFIL